MVAVVVVVAAVVVALGVEDAVVAAATDQETLKSLSKPKLYFKLPVLKVVDHLLDTDLMAAVLDIVAEHLAV